MGFGCLASLALYGAVAFVLLAPTFLPLYLAALLTLWASRDPEWPLY